MIYREHGGNSLLITLPGIEEPVGSLDLLNQLTEHRWLTLSL